MASKINNCPWQAIDGFQSIREFEQFETWINEIVAEHKALEVIVESRYQDIESFSEKWYKHIESSCVWRLVAPDFPFTGLFEAVSTAKS